MIRPATALGVLLVAGVLHHFAPTLFRGAFRLASCPLDEVVGVVPPTALGSATGGLRLQGRRALVVGGTRGIGRGIALTLASHAASVTIVGRSPGEAVVRAMAKRAEAVSAEATSSAPTFHSHAFDLSTVGGCAALVAELAHSTGGGRGYDYVFFTVGVWPNFSDPFTVDGVERVMALDLLARHVVLKGLFNRGLLQPNARIMNTLASTQSFPLVDADWVKERLQSSVGATAVPPRELFSALVPVAAAADAYLQSAASHFPGLTLVGFFPGAIEKNTYCAFRSPKLTHSGGGVVGIVVTDLPAATFPAWIVPVLHALMSPIAISEDECGAAHLAVITSENVARRSVSYFNFLLEGRETTHLAYDKALAEWVWEFVEAHSHAHASAL